MKYSETEAQFILSSSWDTLYSELLLIMNCEMINMVCTECPRKIFIIEATANLKKLIENSLLYSFSIPILGLTEADVFFYFHI